MFPALSMPVLYLFAAIRQPFLDTFFSAITGNRVHRNRSADALVR